MQQTPAPNRKALLGMVVGALAFSLSYAAVQHFFFAPPKFDKVMMELANELNKQCPIQVDQFTRLDNAIALPDNVFQYNYTLVGLTKDEVNLDTVMKYVEPNLINSVRTSPDMRLMRESKTTVNYCYKDKDGVFVHTISITPDMYSE